MNSQQRKRLYNEIGSKMNQGQIAHATSLCVDALKTCPAEDQFLRLLSLIAHRTGKDREATLISNACLKIAPNNLEHIVTRGIIHKTKKEFARAFKLFKLALKLAPNDEQSSVNLADCYWEIGDTKQCIDICEQVLARNPKSVPALHLLGASYAREGDKEKGLDLEKQAIAIAPNYSLALTNVGILYFEQGDVLKAEQYLRKSVAINSEAPIARVNLALSLLPQGKLYEGFAEHEWRFPARSTKQYIANPFNRNQELPKVTRQSLSDITSKKILLCCQQGIGDELMFLRFLPNFLDAGASCDYVSSDKLFPLLKRHTLFTHIYKCGNPGHPKAVYDAVIAVDSAPYILGIKKFKDIPPPIKLTALPPMKDKLKQSIRGTSNKPLIGITWRAGTNIFGRLKKEIPIELLLQEAKQWPCHIVIMQRNMTASEQSIIKQLIPDALDWSHTNDDLELCLAAVDLLDDYATVSNTNVHLRSCLGKGSKILALQQPEYRLLASKALSPWLPKSKIYRQENNGWEKALSTLTSDIVSEYKQ